MNISNHPCFNAKVRGSHGRVHLPIAPRCNIQCKYCDRKYDCVNESRPGVTSAVLTPKQSIIYLDYIFENVKNISVVGIAGPGDPFANPKETMETLRLVRKKYPEIILCLATNGLGISPYIEELAQINVSHVTITLNALDPEIGAQIYSFIRHGKKVLSPKAGFKVLLEKQLEAVQIKDKVSGEIRTLPTPAMFIFIGAVAHTEFLEGVVERNRTGFIVTGPNLIHEGRRPKGWTLKRDPYLLETNVPGIFAAGDVRQGAVRRVASAVGEGAISVSFVHQYLKTV